MEEIIGVDVGVADGMCWAVVGVASRTQPPNNKAPAMMQMAMGAQTALSLSKGA